MNFFIKLIKPDAEEIINDYRVQLTIRFGSMLNDCDPCSFEANVYKSAIARLNNMQDPIKVERWVRKLEVLWQKIEL